MIHKNDREDVIIKAGCDRRVKVWSHKGHWLSWEGNLCQG